jgi:hypothetical protein
MSEVIGEIGGLETAAVANQHVPQPACLDLTRHRSFADAERATRLGLANQQSAARDFLQLLGSQIVHRHAIGVHVMLRTGRTTTMAENFLIANPIWKFF